MRSKKVGLGKVEFVKGDANVTVGGVTIVALSDLSLDDDSELSSSMNGTDSDSSLEPEVT